MTTNFLTFKTIGASAIDKPTIFSKNAGADIKVGRFVAYNTDGNLVEVSSINEVIVGFAYHEDTKAGLVDGVYKEGSAFPMTNHVTDVVVQVSATDIKAGDKVYIDLNTVGKIGYCTNVNTNNKEVAGVFTSKAEGEIAKISFITNGK